MVLGIGRLVKVSALRRVVAVVCALAFLAVSFAHLVHHADFVSDATAIEMSVSADTAGDSQDHSKKTSALEHCHGCMMLAIAVADLPTFADIGASVVDDRLTPLRSIAHAAEYPPPKS